MTFLVTLLFVCNLLILFCQITMVCKHRKHSIKYDCQFD